MNFLKAIVIEAGLITTIGSARFWSANATLQESTIQPSFLLKRQIRRLQSFWRILDFMLSWV